MEELRWGRGEAESDRPTGGGGGQATAAAAARAVRRDEAARTAARGGEQRVHGAGQRLQAERGEEARDSRRRRDGSAGGAGTVRVARRRPDRDEAVGSGGGGEHEAGRAEGAAHAQPNTNTRRARHERDGTSQGTSNTLTRTPTWRAPRPETRTLPHTRAAAPHGAPHPTPAVPHTSARVRRVRAPSRPPFLPPYPVVSQCDTPPRGRACNTGRAARNNVVGVAGALG